MSKIKTLYVQGPDATVPNITNNADGTITVSQITSTGDGVINGVNVGRGAGDSATNTAVGDNALDSNTLGESNTAVGSNALTANTTGVYNTAVGDNALAGNTDGADNTGIGKSALLSNTTGSSNTSVGSGSLGLNISGSNNTAVGKSALLFDTAGSDNTSLGAAAGRSVNQSGNTAVGSGALSNGGGMNGEVAVGLNALSAVAGSNGQNTAVGASSLEVSTRSVQNIAIGGKHVSVITNPKTATQVAGTVTANSALGALTFGNNNIVVGNGGLSAVTTGSSNIAIGHKTVAPATSDNNILIGNGAKVPNVGRQSERLAIDGAVGFGYGDEPLLGGNFVDRILTLGDQSMGATAIAGSSMLKLSGANSPGQTISASPLDPFVNATNTATRPVLPAVYGMVKFEYWLLINNTGTGAITLGWGNTSNGMTNIDVFRADVVVLPQASGTAYAGVNPYVNITNKVLVGGNSIAVHTIHITGFISMKASAGVFSEYLGLQMSVASGTIAAQSGSWMRITTLNRGYTTGNFWP